MGAIMTRFSDRLLIVLDRHLRDQLDAEVSRRSEEQGRRVSRSELVRLGLAALLKPADTATAPPAVRVRTRQPQSREGSP